MKNLQEATERICELKGSLVALDALVSALLQELPASVRQELLHTFEDNAEVARTVLLHAPISEHTLDAFEHDVQRMSAFIASTPKPGASSAVRAIASLSGAPVPADDPQATPEPHPPLDSHRPDAS